MKEPKTRFYVKRWKATKKELAKIREYIKKIKNNEEN